MEKLINQYSDLALDKFITYVPRILFAILVVWVGFKISNKVVKWVDKVLERTGFSDSLRPFLTSLMGFIFKGAILFAAATILGADLTGLVAILAAAGFAVGMALQGSLGNFASGILILTLKPYKISDWIKVDDHFGKVSEIGIFSTQVITPGNKVLNIPNSMITDSVVTNLSDKGQIRLELSVHVPYAESFPKIKQIIIDELMEVPKILKGPKPEVGIKNFDSHSIELLVRPYVYPDDFWEATFQANKAIKSAFNRHGIKVAYSEGIEMGAIGE
ncbi:mechanosensitive ion channel family protein [Sediminicola luteus]|uniref:Mechanosensitive ion channel protein n=1 Tax=Sediminicola luteus TaxID=319238 RepID=A0A2A4G8M2_9FLAO|nr:mechanosensitive ion channel [Sediminicola luteus]PCE64320.1 mechanosensitive ion channel protein [Sediminicola luteus]